VEPCVLSGQTRVWLLAGRQLCSLELEDWGCRGAVGGAPTAGELFSILLGRMLRSAANQLTGAIAKCLGNCKLLNC
jgi:hypothetical protein